jgi:hypothetical protein
MQIVKSISDSTGVLSTLFSMTGMTAATLMWAWRPDHFTSGNWLTALGTCAGLIAAVIGKRAIEGVRKNGNGAQP